MLLHQFIWGISASLLFLFVPDSLPSSSVLICFLVSNHSAGKSMMTRLQRTATFIWTRKLLKLALSKYTYILLYVYEYGYKIIYKIYDSYSISNYTIACIYINKVNTIFLKEMQLPGFILISNYPRYIFPEYLPNHFVMSLAGISSQSNMAWYSHPSPSAYFISSPVASSSC